MDRLSSPFPGMDPFLEEPALRGSVHTRLMNRQWVSKRIRTWMAQRQTEG